MNASHENAHGLRGYAFGRFVVDLSAYALRRGDEVVPITPKAFDTLVVLIRNRDRVVSKDELMSELWPGSFVSEDSLTQSVSVLRRALGDDSSQPQFIATAARHGYRFIAPIHEVTAASEAPAPPQPMPQATPNGARVRAARALRPALVVPAVLAALLIALVVVRIQSVAPVSPRNAGPLRFTQEPPAGTTLVSGGELSPDGRYLAFVAQDNRSGTTQLWVRPLDASEPRALPGTEGASRAFWAPDGQHLGFFANGRLRTVGLDARPPQAIASTDSTTEGGGSWSINGLILFTVLRSGLYSVAATGGAVSAVTTLDPSEQEVAHRWPQFLPDGRHFLMYVDSVRPERRGTYLAALGSTEKTRLIDVAAVYAPPSYLVYVREGSLTTQPIDIAEGRLTGAPTTIAGNAMAATTSNGAVISAAGGLLSFGVSKSGERLEWFSRSGQRMGSIDSSTTLRNPAISTDGRQLLAASNTDPDHKGLWVIELDRGAQTRVASDGMRPFWSPDASRVAFTSDRAAGVADLYLRPLTGRDGEEQAVLKTPENKFICDWSPDGRYLVYGSINAATKSDLWLLPLTGDRRPTPYLVTPNNEVNAQVSPDGRWLAYASDESGRWEVYLQSFPVGGTKAVVSVAGGIEPHWRRDGRELYYLGLDRNLLAVPISTENGTLKSGAPQTLFRAPVPALNVFINWYAAAPDGQRFVINTAGGSGGVQPITVLVNWSARLNP